MHKYRSEGIEERTRLIYELGLQYDYHNTTLTGESYMVDITHKVCDFMDKYHRTPSSKSKDRYEATLGIWITNMKKRKKTRKYVYYPIIESIASDRGYPNLFIYEDLQQNAIDMTYNVCKFVNEYNKITSQTSKDPYERKLSQWLNNMRNSIDGTNNYRGVFYPILEEIALKMGCPNLFIRISDEQMSINMIHKICDFMDTYHKSPSQHSKDDNERKMGMWLRNRRSFKYTNNVKKKLFYPIIETIACERGYPNLFLRK